MIIHVKYLYVELFAKVRQSHFIKGLPLHSTFYVRDSKILILGDLRLNNWKSLCLLSHFETS